MGVTYLFPKDKLDSGAFWEYTDYKNKNSYLFQIYDNGTKLFITKDDELVDVIEIVEFDNIEEKYIIPYIILNTGYD